MGIPGHRKVPVELVEFGVPTGVPEPEDGTTLIVSAIVAGHPSMAGRFDVVAPGPTVVDPETKKVVGCVGLRRYHSAAAMKAFDLTRGSTARDAWDDKPFSTR